MSTVIALGVFCLLASACVVFLVRLYPRKTRVQFSGYNVYIKGPREICEEYSQAMESLSFTPYDWGDEEEDNDAYV